MRSYRTIGALALIVLTTIVNASISNVSSSSGAIAYQYDHAQYLFDQSFTPTVSFLSLFTSTNIDSENLQTYCSFTDSVGANTSDHFQMQGSYSGYCQSVSLGAAFAITYGYQQVQFDLDSTAVVTLSVANTGNSYVQGQRSNAHTYMYFDGVYYADQPADTLITLSVGPGTYYAYYEGYAEADPGNGFGRARAEGDFSVDIQATPEPASMAALSLGAITLLRKRRAK